MKVSRERDNKVWKILTEAAYQGTYLWAVHCIVIDGRGLSTGLFIIVRESRVFGFIVTYALLHYTALVKLQLLFCAIAQYMCEWTLTLENGLDSNSNSNIGICIALPTGKTGSALHGQLRSFGRKGPIEQNSFQTALEGSCRPLRFEVS